MKKKMRTSFFFIFFFVVLAFAILHHSDAVEADPKGLAAQTTKNGSTDPAGVKLPLPDHVKDEEGKKEHEETKKVAGKVDPEEIVTKEKKTDKPLEETKKNPEPEEENKGEKEKKGSKESSGGAKEVNNAGTGVEECDPSNRCIEEKSKFVACLRVPGIDSLDLSLLVQNKGKGSLDIDILAPDLVVLEQNKVQLKAKENKEVKISVRDGAKDTKIVLKGREGNCSLDFGNMISSSFKKSENPASPRYLSRLSARTSFILIFVAVALIVGFSWSCIRFWRMKNRESGPIYQKVEVGLPVSTGVKNEADGVDGWDNSWGDGWDDEEAPVTPSKPVLTPSSKGLASRKSNKDGWKD